MNLATLKDYALLLARLIFASVFLYSAWYKIPGSESFAGQVQMSDAAGIPFPYLAVLLAFALEVIASIMLIVGWYTRYAAAALIVFLILIIAFFVRDLSDQFQMIILFSSLQIIAGLLYVVVYGAQSIAIKKDQ